jgi:hypothetical protein
VPVCIFAATLSALHQEYGESPRLGNGELTRREDPVTSVLSDTGERPVFAPASKQDAQRASTLSGPVAAAGKGAEIVGDNNSKEKQMESSNMKR